MDYRNSFFDISYCYALYGKMSYAREYTLRLQTLKINFQLLAYSEFIFAKQFKIIGLKHSLVEIGGRAEVKIDAHHPKLPPNFFAGFKDQRIIRDRCKGKRRRELDSLVKKMS